MLKENLIMDLDENIRFTLDHDWLLPQKDGTLLFGKTDYGLIKMPNILSVELPEPDSEHHYCLDEGMCVIESQDLTIECLAPLICTVTEINTDLLVFPELINEDPFEQGWILRLSPDHPEDLDEFFNIEEYEARFG